MAAGKIIKGHIEICRFDHWIKNIFVLPGLLMAWVYAPQPLLAPVIFKIIIGMLALGLVTSSNYVLNEILDAPFDRLHPRKYTRPVASGRVNIPVAYGQWILLMLAGLALAAQVSQALTIVLAVLWVMGCVYNMPPVRSKDVPYLDVLSEAINNPLRLLAGWAMISPSFLPSASLLLSYWMLGCYLMALKRFAELRDIGGRMDVAGYRKSFKHYSETNLLVSVMFYAAASMLFLGAFIMRYKIEMILSFPFVAWVMAHYMWLAFQPESAVQAPEKLYREPMLIIATTLCAGVMIALFLIRCPAFDVLFAPTMPLEGMR